MTQQLEYGVCPGCKKRVNLVYEAGDSRRPLVIGAHDKPTEQRDPRLEKISSIACLGVGRRPDAKAVLD